MSADPIYITGTRHPGSTLLRFLPDYLDMLLHQGHPLITTHKKGVDEAIIAHCDTQQLSLQVFAFHTNDGLKRDCPPIISDHTRVQQVYSPTWLRFRHMAQVAPQMVFLHSAKSRGTRLSIPTSEAFVAACARRGVAGKQLIVQHQSDTWLCHPELRGSPTISTAHVYLYVRHIHDAEDHRLHIGHYRIETWRQIKGVVQPGCGKRELVVTTQSALEALLKILKHALLVLQNTPPYQLVIHHSSAQVQRIAENPVPGAAYADLRRAVRDLLKAYAQVKWVREPATTLRDHIGAHIQEAQQLWYHDKAEKAVKGLYR